MGLLTYSSPMSSLGVLSGSHIPLFVHTLNSISPSSSSSAIALRTPPRHESGRGHDAVSFSFVTGVKL
ncbi:hypothetical protein RRG08_028374 [Elysia crispata]|uniref:Uncharacterized protein n=1 Tax=Elysia crispata TaxID=231223 RepID=A0AAE1AWQ7_9GAST|nr:hypothetical protein RRG08_028374 [Elysia crispata]